MEHRRLHGAVAQVDGTAMVPVGGHLAPHVGAGYQLRFQAEQPALLVEFARHGREMCRGPGATEPSRDHEVAGDALPRDQVLGEGQRLAALAQNAQCLGLAVAPPQLAQPDPVAAADHAAAAGTGTAARPLGVEYQDRAPRAGQGERRRQTRVAAANHEHVDAASQRALGRGAVGRRLLPPVGLARRHLPRLARARRSLCPSRA